MAGFRTSDTREPAQQHATPNNLVAKGGAASAFVDNRTSAIAQAMRQEVADRSSGAIQLQALKQRMNGRQSDSEQLANAQDTSLSVQHKPMPQSSQLNSVIQAYRILNGPTYSPKGSRAGTSELEIECDGKIGGAGANSPLPATTASMPGRAKIRSGKKGMQDNDEPFAMHLINGRLGGSGVDRENLAWGTSAFNGKHYNEWELARQVNAKSHQNMTMKVEAFYESNSKNDPASYYLLSELECTHELAGQEEESVTVKAEGLSDFDGEWNPNKKKKGIKKGSSNKASVKPNVRTRTGVTKSQAGRNNVKSKAKVKKKIRIGA